MTDVREQESAEAVTGTRRVKATMTRTMWVDVPTEEAEWLLDRKCDITTQADHVTRWLRIAGQGYEFMDSWLELEDGSDDWPRPYWAPDVVDGAGWPDRRRRCGSWPLAVDHVDWPEVKAWQWMRWMVSHIRRHGLMFGAQR